MKRRPGVLLPIEISILGAIERLAVDGVVEPHGLAIALKMRERREALRLTSHGTLYRALERLDNAGLLTSRREDPMVADREGRPVRRMYAMTPDGAEALARARTMAGTQTLHLKQRPSEA